MGASVPWVEALDTAATVWAAVRPLPACPSCPACPEAAVSHVVPPALEAAVQVLLDVSISGFWVGFVIGFIVAACAAVTFIVCCAVVRRSHWRRPAEKGESEAHEDTSPLLGLRIANGPIAPSDLARRKWRPPSIGR